MLASPQLKGDEALRRIAEGQGTLEPGARGEAVKALQQALIALGQRVSADGSFGPGTRAAVAIFQAAAGLPTSGAVDAATLLALDARLLDMDSRRDADPAPPAAGPVYFSDADALDAPPGIEAELAGTLKGLLRADLSGTSPGAVLRTIRQARGAERMRIAFALADALEDEDLAGWIHASVRRRQRATEIAELLAPPDPSAAHNKAVNEAVAAFTAWNEYASPLIIVPGYTPLDQKEAAPGVHPTTMRRLTQAVQDVRDRKAPFLLVSGANVYPRGTPYYEAIEMKKALVSMGFPEDRIVVEARARHSTTNLRNAGRYMLARGFAAALITTMGGGILGGDIFDQDFYFSNPTLSTFYARCERELGYRVGELESAGPRHTTFRPSPDVRRINYRDPLDP